MQDVSKAPLAKRRKMKKSSTDACSSSSFCSTSSYASSVGSNGSHHDRPRAIHKADSGVSLTASSTGFIATSCQSGGRPSRSDSQSSVFDFKESRVQEYLSSLSESESSNTSRGDSGSSESEGKHKLSCSTSIKRKERAHPDHHYHRPVTRSKKRKLHAEAASSSSCSEDDCKSSETAKKCRTKMAPASDGHLRE